MIRWAWLGHSSVALEMAGLRILTDPLLGAHAGVLRRHTPAPDPSLWADPDAVLVSHLHLDHAQPRSLRMAAGREVLSGGANGRWLRERAGVNGRELRAGRWHPIGPASAAEVRLVRADHRHRPMPHRPNAAHGFLIRTASAVVWFAGDTGRYPGMAELADLAQAPIDLALLPIWGWGPRLSPGHMGPEDAALAAALAGARAVLPIHHGTFHPPGLHLTGMAWFHTPARRFASAMATIAPGVIVLEANAGHTVPGALATTE